MANGSVIERPQWYVQQFPNPGSVSGFQDLGQGLNLDTDAPFVMRGVAVYGITESGVPNGAASGLNCNLRFTRPDGYWMQKHLMLAQMINPYDAGAQNGAGGNNGPFFSYFSPIHPNVLYPAASTITLDFQDAFSTIEMKNVLVVFVGTKLFRPGQVWQPTYPANYTRRPYFGYEVQIDMSTIPALNVPFNVLLDADFVWQCGSQSDYRPNFNGLGVRIKDWAGKYYMNDYVPLELIFGFDNSQTPGLVYPEIYIPRQQALYLDIASF